MTEISVTKQQAQNFLLNRSFFVKKSDLSTVITAYSCIQVDPISVVAKSHELALFNRVEDFSLQDLSNALYKKRTMFEYWLQLYSILPIDFYHHVSARRSGSERWHEKFENDNRKSIQAALEYITEHGPTSSKELSHLTSTSSLFSWSSSGSKTALLEYLWDKGEIMISHREGLRKYFDLTSRILPGDFLQNSVSTQKSLEWTVLANFKYLGLVRNVVVHRAGYSRRMPLKDIFKQFLEKGQIVKVKIEGVKSPYYVLKEDVALLRGAKDNAHADAHAVTFLPPLDPFVIDRRLIFDIFDFSYLWEAYVPAAKRKFGYYGMPVLASGKLVGQVEFQKTPDKKLTIKNIDIKKLSKREQSSFDSEQQRLEKLIFPS